MLTIEEKRELVKLAELRERRRKQRRLFAYTPYPKQLEFHAAGKDHRERLLMAGNQVGKTWSMGFELAMHLTGRYPGPGEIFYPDTPGMREAGLVGQDVYPEGWPGYRFDRAIWVWASSVSGEATRDNPQRILVGPPTIKEEWGTGAIPHADLLIEKGEMSYKMASGTADGIDHILVKHVRGGTSILQFKSYSQGREKWQGPTLDFVWYDEEPPQDIYLEGLTRTNKTQGPNALTFTPLLGLSQVVGMYIGTEQPELAEAEETE